VIGIIFLTPFSVKIVCVRIVWKNNPVHFQFSRTIRLLAHMTCIKVGSTRTSKERIRDEMNRSSRLPFLASSGFTLARNSAVLGVDVVDGADDADWNDEETQDAEENVGHGGLLLNRHQLRLECQRRVG